VGRIGLGVLDVGLGRVGSRNSTHVHLVSATKSNCNFSFRHFHIRYMVRHIQVLHVSQPPVMPSAILCKRLSGHDEAHFQPNALVTLTAESEQEAQLPQRNSASAAHMEGGWG